MDASRKADDAARVAERVAANLAEHYRRVEATYEASREATLSLLAYLQGRHDR